MPRSAPVDGFSLAYTDTKPDTADPVAVVLVHGWPGDSSDYRLVGPLLEPEYRVVVPDLRGFGDSDRHPGDPDRCYSAAAQADSVAALIDELGLVRPVVAGYDIGSRVCQRLAVDRPELVGGLALSPPMPGVGSRVLDPAIVPELWYQYFHRSPLSIPMLDGNRDLIHQYLHHFWSRWSAPGFLVDSPEFEALVDGYARPGAFEAATNWYRATAGYVHNALAEQVPPAHERIQAPTHVLWQELDPLFPRGWADRLTKFFSEVTLHEVDGVGHFTPLEAPEQFAATARAAARDRRSGDLAPP
jgi:pimeloyl-ACP methyl ester carboxylesterase